MGEIVHDQIIFLPRTVAFRGFQLNIYQILICLIQMVVITQTRNQDVISSNLGGREVSANKHDRLVSEKWYRFETPFKPLTNRTE